MFFAGYPFDGPHGMGREVRRPPVDNTKLYKILGIQSTSTVLEIKKAYRKLAIQHHPDKGGDPEAFKEIGRAYEVLSDPEKRRVYDEAGEAGLEGQMQSDPTDIFDLFFGGNRKSAYRGKRKGDDVVSPVRVTLEQIYQGITRKLAVNRDILCNECEGRGGPESAFEICGNCNGSGVKVQIRQAGHMIQQTQSACMPCKGKGKNIADSKKCQKCSGNGLVKEKKILEVIIERGVPNGHKIAFKGEADERPNEIPGDVIFVVDTQEHQLFKRRNCDLYLKKTITLSEALCGYKFTVKHLDGRTIIIKSKPNTITRPNDIYQIDSEGMPPWKGSASHGNLYIIFDIQFPSEKSLDEKKLIALANLLPKPAKIDIPNDADTVYPKYTDPDELNTRQQQKDPYDESDDEQHQQSQSREVGCAPQ